MSFINVLAPGFQTSVQGASRLGYTQLGVSPSGAADFFSLRLGNILVGNPQRAAALEMTLVGSELVFENQAIIALAGSDFGPTLDGKPIPIWSAIAVGARQKLQLSSTKSGARCYLCIRGGIDVPLLLGSASTHLTTKMGGYEGRALKKGDVLFFRNGNEKQSKAATLDLPSLSPYLHRDVVRVTEALQTIHFNEKNLNLFSSSAYTVSENSNRMGLRLKGHPIRSLRSSEIMTEGVPLGAVQVPSDGQPIISFVEHQTTGGYPKIANVIAADIHRVGQLRPRDSVRFEWVTIEQAIQSLREQEQFIQMVEEKFS